MLSKGHHTADRAATNLMTIPFSKLPWLQSLQQVTFLIIFFDGNWFILIFISENTERHAKNILTRATLEIFYTIALLYDVFEMRHNKWFTSGLYN